MKTVWKIVIFVLLCILILVLLRYLTLNRSQNRFETLVNQTALESVPGKSEIYKVQEHRVLQLNDIGLGTVNLGYRDTEWPGVIAWKKDARYVNLEFWTMDANDSITLTEYADLHIGDDFVFGGYRVELVHLPFLVTSFWNGSYFAFIEISLAE